MLNSALSLIMLLTAVKFLPFLPCGKELSRKYRWPGSGFRLCNDRISYLPPSSVQNINNLKFMSWMRLCHNRCGRVDSRVMICLAYCKVELPEVLTMIHGLWTRNKLVIEVLLIIQTRKSSMSSMKNLTRCLNKLSVPDPTFIGYIGKSSKWGI